MSKVEGYTVESLREYIYQEHQQGGQAAFARAHNISTRGVTDAINRGDIVVNGVQYSPRRVLEPKALEIVK